MRSFLSPAGSGNTDAQGMWYCFGFTILVKERHFLELSVGFPCYNTPHSTGQGISVGILPVVRHPDTQWVRYSAGLPVIVKLRTGVAGRPQTLLGAHSLAYLIISFSPEPEANNLQRLLCLPFGR